MIFPRVMPLVNIVLLNSIKYDDMANTRCILATFIKNVMNIELLCYKDTRAI